MSSDDFVSISLNAPVLLFDMMPVYTTLLAYAVCRHTQCTSQVFDRRTEIISVPRRLKRHCALSGGRRAMVGCLSVDHQR